VVAPAEAELEAEQAHIDQAYACLAAMRDRVKLLHEDSLAKGYDKELQLALAHRVHVLTDTGRPLCFGRIDEEDGATWWIGRRHVEDERSDPVVVEWRAPVAIPFYRARASEPLGLHRRRQLSVDGRKLVTIADDVFGGDASDGDSDAHRERIELRGRDALMAELERSRTGEMLDIVATIQREQDEVIRAPLEGVLTVQGGPGSGKTAVGLHRAAYLIYSTESLSRDGVLIVGPNRTFLRYIATVLPSLGEEAVLQTVFADLVPELEVTAVDPLDTQRVKGDARMAQVLARALVLQRRSPTEGIEVRFGSSVLRLTHDEVAEVFSDVAGRRLPFAVGRQTLRDALIRRLHAVYTRRLGQMRAAEYPTVAKAIRADASFKRALDSMWPSMPAPGLVRSLISQADLVAGAGEALLTVDEQRALVAGTPRRGRKGWSDADLPLVDEAQFLLTGQARTYGHVVVDEAQDLTPMQIRMLARRCPTGSMTILGDIAQATGVWGHDSWDEVLAHLPTPDGARIEELRLGYRATTQVLELASRLLPEAAPQVRPTESVRRGRTDPTLRRVATFDLEVEAVAEAQALAGRYNSVGLITPGPRLAAIEELLAAAGADTGDAVRDGLGHGITVMQAISAKGLEFDAVVVVEPSEVITEAPRGLRLLYVALSRPTQHLSVIHADDLPGGLAPF
jgi:DNA helicase IV